MRQPSVTLPSDFTDTEKYDQLVVPTSRLAQELRYQHECDRFQSGATVWKQPSILSYEQWLLGAYTTLAWSHPQLAKRSVIPLETLLFVAQRNAPDKEVEIHARSIIDAWQLAWNYNLWTVYDDISTTENGQLCKDWFERLQRFLDRNEFITVSEIPQVLQRAIERDDWVPKSVIAFGFNEPTVAQNNLLSALEAREHAVLVPIDNSHDIGNQSIVQFESKNNERTTLAVWAREKLATLGEDASIGIVVSDLAASHQSIKRQFENVFPEVNDITQLISIDAGLPLNSTRLYADFNTLLRWTVGEVFYVNLLNLAKSPYFNRLELATQTESFFSEQMTLRYYNSRYKGEGETVLNRLTQIVPRSRNKEMSFTEATDLLKNILRTCGLTSRADEEFSYVDGKAVKLLTDSLERVTRMGNLMPRVRWSEYVDLVDSFVRDQSGRTSSAKAPIQILGRNASEHLQFDALWVTGMSDADWPAPVRPNPFIPVSMQKQAKVPSITHESSFDRAKQLTANWRCHANEVIFSFFNETDEIEAKVSAILPDSSTPEILSAEDIVSEVDHIAHAHPWSNHVVPDVSREYHPVSGLKLTSADYERGRTTMLKDQAQCPFKSWATHRLGVTDGDSPRNRFPDPKQRGTLFHEVAETIVKKARNRDALSSYLRETKRIRKVIENAVDEDSATKSMPVRFKRHEIDRIARMVTKWLELEAEREYFDVLHTEKDIVLEIGGLEFKGRIDRIDKTENHSCAVIDLKTGNVSPTSWNPARLKETQMPMYALSQKDCDALGYISVKRYKENVVASLRGASNPTEDEKTGRPNKKHFNHQAKLVEEFGSFEELKNAWDLRLKELVKDLLDGRANVDPVDTSVCRYCHLTSLCRIFEQTDLIMPDENEEGEQ